jgi:RHS repeat-associated protein
VVKTSKAEDGTERHSLEVFGSLRFERDTFDEVAGDYARTPARTHLYLGGGVGHAFADTGTLPAPVGSPAVRMFLTMGDHLGSATVTVDATTSEVVERATFQPFGAMESDYRPDRWGDNRELYKFTGKEEDIEVGATYFGARYYQPHLGRFMSADPLAVHGMGGDLNPYAYVRGRVMTHVDPLGLDDTPSDMPATVDDEGPDNTTAFSGHMGTIVGTPPVQYSGELTIDLSTSNTRSLDSNVPSPLLWGRTWGVPPIPTYATRGNNASSAGGVPTSDVQNLPSSRADWLARENPTLAKYIYGKQREDAFLTVAPVILGVLTDGSSVAIESGSAAEATAGASGRALPGLAELPADVAVPIHAADPIAIPRALNPTEMAALMNTTGNIEFSQTFANGQHWLTRASFATPNRVYVLPDGPGTSWISHTHPVGYSGLPSAADRVVLQKLGQGASRVVRPDGSSLRFGP